jgi:hypothetical protein
MHAWLFVSSLEKYLQTCNEIRPREVLLDGLDHSRAVQDPRLTSSFYIATLRRRPEERRGDAEELGAVPCRLEDGVLRAGGRCARGGRLLRVRSQTAPRITLGQPGERGRVSAVIACGERRGSRGS